MDCCSGHGGRFPTLPLILIVVGVIWLLNDLGIIATDIPWFPVAIIIFGIGWLIDSRKKDSG